MRAHSVYILLACLLTVSLLPASAQETGTVLDLCGDRPLSPMLEVRDSELEPAVIGHDPLTGQPIYRPGSGIVSGTGTADDPFVISGWCILWGGLAVFVRGIEVIQVDAHLVIRDNVIHGFESAIHLYGSSNITVEENRVLENRNGIGLWYTRDSVVSRNVAERDSSGIAVLDSSDILVEENKVEASRTAAISVYRSSDVVVRGNEVRDTERRILYETAGDGAIRIETSTGTMVEENLVEGAKIKGIATFLDSGTQILRNHLVGNRMGVEAAGAKDLVVADNTITGNEEHGLQFWDWRGSTDIRDNLVAANGGDGVHAWFRDEHQVSTFVLRSNDLVGNGGAGVRSPIDPVDARENWWGCAGGPEDPACDAVVGFVSYAPWLTDPAPDAGV